MLQIFARLLDGKTTVFRFSSGSAHGYQIKEKIFETTGIPPLSQRLIYSGVQLKDDSLVSDRDSTVHLTLRLPGGKGGFGSLLRGAATKAGQKKTNNFDACRDMSGRRLRHVNAEKRLEEWRAGEEERRLEKLAEEFLKKETKKKGGNKAAAAERAAERYVQGYREQSAKCVNEVEEAVKEACGMAQKRKEKDPIDSSHNKRFKIWMGNRNLAESDSDCSTDDENDDERRNKSTITSSATARKSKDEAEQSSDSVTGGGTDDQYVAGSSRDSGTEEEKEVTLEQNSVASLCVENPSNQPDSAEQGSSVIMKMEASGIYGMVTDAHIAEDHSPEEVKRPDLKLESPSATVPATNADNDLEITLNFEEYSSAADLEILGLEKLKIHLQRYGLKCGGTLEERAARLFLLKTTPLEKLPKKLFSKK